MLRPPGRPKRARVRHLLIRLARKGVRFCVSDEVAEVIYRLVRNAYNLPGLKETDWYWRTHSSGADRTVYIVGLFGSGRSYINELLTRHIGLRAKYFRSESIRAHAVPTSMIYSGHATVRYPSRGQEPPAVMGRISRAIEAGFADLIFIYRHPLDSLLTNWVCWRMHIQECAFVFSISAAYPDTDAFCADLDRNFSEFKAFAEGHPDFFRALPGPPFLSFSQFLEETELHLRAATLAVRLEDFAVDPAKEFARIAAIMSVDPGATAASMARPRTAMYRYSIVKEKVPQFREFIEQLSPDTKARIEALGYSL